MPLWGPMKYPYENCRCGIGDISRGWSWGNVATPIQMTSLHPQVWDTWEICMKPYNCNSKQYWRVALDTENRAAEAVRFFSLVPPMTFVAVMSRLIVTLIYHLRICQPDQSVGGQQSWNKGVSWSSKESFYHQAPGLVHYICDPGANILLQMD